MSWAEWLYCKLLIFNVVRLLHNTAFICRGGDCGRGSFTPGRMVDLPHVL